ncbi:hypothetical protein ABZ312_24430 [Streptomyces sp. NPDC006207]
MKTAARIKGAFDGPAVLSDVLSTDMRVGLRRWVESTFLVPERRGRSRGVMVELHHDGTVAIAVDLAHGLGHGGGIAVNTQTLQVVVREAVALADAFRRHRAPDSSLDITATVTTGTKGSRLLPFGGNPSGYALYPDTRHPRRLMPASTELAPHADDAALRECAHELSTGLLHQFGINVHR